MSTPNGSISRSRGLAPFLLWAIVIQGLACAAYIISKLVFSDQGDYVYISGLNLLGFAMLILLRNNSIAIGKLEDEIDRLRHAAKQTDD